MVNYDVFITWSEEDNAYIASVPEFAGCIADGQTREDALQNIEIVAQEWMETAEEKELTREIGQEKAAAN